MFPVNDLHSVAHLYYLLWTRFITQECYDLCIGWCCKTALIVTFLSQYVWVCP